jgi:hypothetical protein
MILVMNPMSSFRFGGIGFFIFLTVSMVCYDAGKIVLAIALYGKMRLTIQPQIRKLLMIRRNYFDFKNTG